MKILQICSKVPFPPKDGGSVAMNILTQGLLAAGNDLTVLAVLTPKHFIEEHTIDEAYRKKTNYRSVFIDTSVKALPAFLNLFSTGSYNLERFYSKKFEQVLIELLKTQRFDVIQLETLWVTPYLSAIRKYSDAKIVLRSQNIEYSIWERLAAASGNPLKARYMRLLASRLKKYEHRVLNQFDAILPITAVDLKAYQQMGCTVPLYCVPFGIDLKQYVYSAELPEFPSLFHLGAMDWRPNADGIKWILDEVWPEIHREFPDVKFYLGGRNMPDWMLSLNLPNVLVVGEVPDAQAFIRSKAIMLVPLSSGGGMRVKIIEGMALGKAIISTSIGAEGIDCTAGKNCLIANSKDEFLHAIRSLISNLAACTNMGAEARKLIEQQYDNAKICRELTDFYTELIAK